ncbi:MAG: hypothetical protein FJ319_02620 [SAR202 cluster bacterium]|nr:hypothetical protein [SAR202 cluster bacterium]
MTSSQFTKSLFTYPWDLVDEGLDVSLGRIADLTGCNEVMLTPAYHRSAYFLPHNPKRPIYNGENGAIYFTPDLSKYSKTRIRPRVSHIVDRPLYFESILEAMDRRGLQFASWTVYNFNDYLSEKYPQFARHDALGTTYIGSMSVSSQDVQEYWFTVTKEILERFKPKALNIESLDRRGFQAPSKRRAEFTAQCQFVLSLDFNPAAVAKANEAGMDGDGLKRDVAEWLRVRLARVATAEDELPVTPEWVSAAFDGQLRRYMDVCKKTTSDLFVQVADIIHSHGVKVQTGSLADPAASLRDDLDPSVNKHLDIIFPGAIPAGEEGKAKVRDSARKMAPGAKVYSWLKTSDGKDSVTTRAGVQAAVDAGASGCMFYNYGLLRIDQLKEIGTALRAAGVA